MKSKERFLKLSLFLLKSATTWTSMFHRVSEGKAEGMVMADDQLAFCHVCLLATLDSCTLPCAFLSSLCVVIECWTGPTSFSTQESLFLANWTEFLPVSVLWAWFLLFNTFCLNIIEIKSYFELCENYAYTVTRAVHTVVLLFKHWAPEECSSYAETFKSCTVVNQLFPVKCTLAMQLILQPWKVREA